MSGKGEWHTPISVLKHKQTIWEKLEKCERVRILDMTTYIRVVYCHSYFLLQDKNIELAPEISYFNNPVTFKPLEEYDLFFAYTKTFPLYDDRKSRENRLYLPDIYEGIFQQVRM